MRLPIKRAGDFQPPNPVSAPQNGTGPYWQRCEMRQLKQVVSRARFRLEYEADPRGDDKCYGRYVEVNIVSHQILECGLPVPHRSGFRRGNVAVRMGSERQRWSKGDLLNVAARLKRLFPLRSATRIDDLELYLVLGLSSPLEIHKAFRVVCLETIENLLTCALPKPIVILRPTLERSGTWLIGDDGVPVSDFDAYCRNQLPELVERQPQWLIESQRSYFTLLDQLTEKLEPKMIERLEKMGCQRVSEILACHPAEFQAAGFSHEDFRRMKRQYLYRWHPSQLLINALRERKYWDQD